MAAKTELPTAVMIKNDAKGEPSRANIQPKAPDAIKTDVT